MSIKGDTNFSTFHTIKKYFIGHVKILTYLGQKDNIKIMFKNVINFPVREAEPIAALHFSLLSSISNHKSHA